MGRRRRHFAVVYGGLEEQYTHGSFAVRDLNSRTPEAAIKEARRFMIGDRENWHAEIGSGGEIEVTNEYGNGDGLLLDDEWAPPEVHVVEILASPAEEWSRLAKRLQAEFAAEQKAVLIEQAERAELERLQKKYG